MSKYKVCVYAIAKNESAFVKRWVDSMKEADGIYVLDTGSTDDTVSLLKDLNVHVKSEVIEPWRFDVARNTSLKMVPEDTDICVCTDLDEVFEKGWREKLESAWTEKTDHARYNYNWSFDQNGNPEVNFYIEKIHRRHGYIWKHPVHEVLSTELKHENVITIDSITLNHYPDIKKSRSSYLPLLELSVKEDPEDDRNMHYLGREYMYQHRYQECIDTLIEHLRLPKATWKEERSASMRFIARSYKELGRFDEAKMWLDKAIQETPYLRDPYVERVLLEYQLNNWEEIKKYGYKALEIKKHEKVYINEPFSWNETIYDLLSLAHYHLNEKEDALKMVNKALEINPNDERIQENKKWIENMK